MLRKLYDWTMRQAAKPHARRTLGLVSFAESSFFPIPPDAMLVPMVLADPKAAWRLATIATIGSVLGGVLGYAIGYYLYESIGAWLMTLYGQEDGIEAFRAAYREWGLWIIVIKGMTPIPYKVVTIASGLAGFNFWIFIVASILTRGARFFLVAALLRRYGDPIREFIERRLTLVTTLFAVAIVGGILALRFI